MRANQNNVYNYFLNTIGCINRIQPNTKLEITPQGSLDQHAIHMWITKDTRKYTYGNLIKALFLIITNQGNSVSRYTVVNKKIIRYRFSLEMCEYITSDLH